MADPSAIFSAINTAFKLAEFAIALNEVGTENAVFVRTIQRVRYDLQETERLLNMPAVKATLEKSEDKRLWIKGAIHSTKSALNDIGLFVERARSDNQRDGTISFANRVRWVLGDLSKLNNRVLELSACHQTLGAVLATLHPLETLSTIVASRPDAFDNPPPSYNTVVGKSDFRSPYMRKKDRKKRAKEEEVVGGQVRGFEKASPIYPQNTINQDYTTSIASDSHVKAEFISNTNLQEKFEPKIKIKEMNQYTDSDTISESPMPAKLAEVSFSLNSFGRVNDWDVATEVSSVHSPMGENFPTWSSITPVELDASSTLDSQGGTPTANRWGAMNRKPSESSWSNNEDCRSSELFYSTNTMYCAAELSGLSLNDRGPVELPACLPGSQNSQDSLHTDTAMTTKKPLSFRNYVSNNRTTEGYTSIQHRNGYEGAFSIPGMSQEGPVELYCPDTYPQFSQQQYNGRVNPCVPSENALFPDATKEKAVTRYPLYHEQQQRFSAVCEAPKQPLAYAETHHTQEQFQSDSQDPSAARNFVTMPYAPHYQVHTANRRSFRPPYPVNRPV